MHILIEGEVTETLKKGTDLRFVSSAGHIGVIHDPHLATGHGGRETKHPMQQLMSQLSALWKKVQLNLSY